MNAPVAPAPEATSDQAGWTMIAAILALVALLQAIRPLPIDPASLMNLVLACAALAGAAIFYRRVRDRPNFSAMCIGLSQVLLFSAGGSILSYLLAREGGALWDGTFSRWDRALGFDWLAYVRLIDSSAPIAFIYRMAYASLIPQILVLVLFFGFTLRMADLRATIFAAILCGTITILLSPLFPAVSQYVALGIAPGDLAHLDPFAGYVHLAHFNALRDGSMGVLRLPDMQGIITFPSYHAGLATVTLWAFWRTRTPWLRWPGATVALLTIAATPVDGGHYLVDVLAGCAIAAGAIATARHAIGWRAVAGQAQRDPLAALTG